jgi:RNA polymerase sigma-70 factor, ECF subfamily
VVRVSLSDRRGGAPRSSRDDEAILRALKEGDERVFGELVERWSGAMLRMALVHLDRRAVAEEVVQEAWLTVLRRLDRFEGRSALRTWVLGIVVNLARARARTERRWAPFAPESGPVLEPARFRPSEAAEWPDHWAIGPVPWPTPEDELLAGETRQVILRALEELPPAQREVLVLRDVEGCSAAETCTTLGLSDTNQRVLLHRARSRARQAIEDYFEATEPT